MTEPKSCVSKIEPLTDAEIEAVAGGVIPIVLRPGGDDYTPLTSVGSATPSAVPVGGFHPVDGGLF